MADKRQEASVAPVPAEDPAKKDDTKPSEGQDATAKEGTEDKKGKKAQEELSAEDVALKEELDMLVERLRELDTSLYRPALETLRTLIRTSTSSMTSVPKPLKFLRPHFPELKHIYYAWGSVVEHTAATKENEQVEKEVKQSRLAELIARKTDGESATGTSTPAPTIPKKEIVKPTLQTNGDSKSRPADLAKADESLAKLVLQDPEIKPELSEPVMPDPGSVKNVAVNDQCLLAEILSVLAMTYSDSGLRETLSFRLRGDRKARRGSSKGEVVGEDPGLWGHEYVRHLAAEIGEAYLALQLKDAEDDEEGEEENKEDGVGDEAELKDLAMRLISFLLTHNGEADAVDLLLEIECIEEITQKVSEHNYARVCNYMLSCVSFLVPPDDAKFLRTCRDIYRIQARFSESLCISIRMMDKEGVEEDFAAPNSTAMKMQLAHLIARHQLPALSADLTQDETLLDALNNIKLTAHFKAFGQNLNVIDPKSLEDIYKSHLEPTRSTTDKGVDSARQNLAGTFVNAFVNAGFGNDKLMVGAEEGQSWIYKNKDHGMMAAAASLGVSLLWDTDGGLSAIDKYTYATEEYIKAGALLANGLLHSGVRSEMDVALALLADYVPNPSVPLRVSATIGIGIAYAGTHREDLMELFLPLVSDTTLVMEVSAMAALSLGFIFVGSGNGEVAGTILQAMMEREDKDLSDKWGRYLALGLALLYLGLQDAADATLETLKVLEHPIGKQASVLVDVCSFAGTGNVLKIQAMLHHCSDHLISEKEEEKEREDELQQIALHQQLAVLGIAVVAMGEEVGAEMTLRQFGHLMQYGEAPIRRAVPLALGLISVSNPVLTILDTLSKYSHDSDLAVALNAIFAMGLVGAGTNNAKLGQMLRQLASYYHKEPDCLFMVRIAQGLVHLGKGTLGLGPFHTDRQLMSPVAVAGLLSTILAFTDARSFVLDKSHWLLFLITPAMYPRFVMTFDEEGKAIETSVRVGTAIDVVGQAGKPKSISGFQTHTTPVRIGNTERAELATDEWMSYNHVLEGIVILRKNPGWESEDKK